MGASGSGTTTLGEALSREFGYRHLDSDDFFWKVKYTDIWPKQKRLELLQSEIVKQDNWILSGSCMGWGDPLIEEFDLVIFLSVPNDERMKRLYQRELDRGRDVEAETFHTFIEWANSYETGGLDVRSRKSQELWLEKITCPVLRLSGLESVNERIEAVVKTTA